MGGCGARCRHTCTHEHCSTHTRRSAQQHLHGLQANTTPQYSFHPKPASLSSTILSGGSGMVASPCLKEFLPEDSPSSLLLTL